MDSLTFSYSYVIFSCLVLWLWRFVFLSFCMQVVHLRSCTMRHWLYRTLLWLVLLPASFCVLVVLCAYCITGVRPCMCHWSTVVSLSVCAYLWNPAHKFITACCQRENSCYCVDWEASFSTFHSNFVFPPHTHFPRTDQFKPSACPRWTYWFS